MSICVLSRWPFICFQITEERQDPGVGGRGRKHNCNMWSPVSRQNDFVRRLVCTLLSSCGQYFSKGSVGRRLDAFLASVPALRALQAAAASARRVRRPGQQLSWPQLAAE